MQIVDFVVLEKVNIASCLIYRGLYQMGDNIFQSENDGYLTS